MIKPEQVPLEAREAMQDYIFSKYGGVFKPGDTAAAIVAALNAWPGAFEFRSSRLLGQCLALPLPEKNDVD